MVLIVLIISMILIIFFIIPVILIITFSLVLEVNIMTGHVAYT